MKSKSKIELIPKASNLISSLKSVGYSMETSIADLIDNSVTANATEIELVFGWMDGKASFHIYDNGHGMNEGDLLNAMTFASSHVSEERSKQDLGRFGLGLKVASFSHCRVLQVASKKANSSKVSYVWDLNELEKQNDNRWTVLRTDETDLDEIEFPDGHGSYVFWKDIDSIASKLIGEEDFLEIINSIEKHLSKTFHNFIEDGLSISINGKEVISNNPIYEVRPIYTSPTERLGINFAIKAYVYDELSSDRKKLFGRYFIYRAERLICSGTIKQLIKSDFKNINLEIFIENSLDTQWSIDIAKSKAIPPHTFQKQINEFLIWVNAKVPRKKSPLKKTTSSDIWFKNSINGEFQINTDHPLVYQLTNILEEKNKNVFFKLLAEIERSIPRYVEKIYIDKPIEEIEKKSLTPEVKQEIKIQLLRLIKIKKMSRDVAINKLKSNDLFQSFEKEIESIAEQVENSVG